MDSNNDKDVVKTDDNINEDEIKTTDIKSTEVVNNTSDNITIIDENEHEPKDQNQNNYSESGKIIYKSKETTVRHRNITLFDQLKKKINDYDNGNILSSRTKSEKVFDKTWNFVTTLTKIIFIIIMIIFAYVILSQIRSNDINNLNSILSIKNAIMRHHNIIRPIEMKKYNNIYDFTHDMSTHCYNVDIMSKKYQTNEHTLSLKNLYLENGTLTILLDNITQIVTELNEALETLNHITDYICTFHFQYNTTFSKKGALYMIDNKNDIDYYNVANPPCICIWRLNPYQKLDHIEKYNHTITYTILDLIVSTYINSSEPIQYKSLKIENDQFIEKSSRIREYTIPLKSNVSIYEWNPLRLKKLFFEDIDAVMSSIIYDEWSHKNLSNIKK